MDDQLYAKVKDGQILEVGPIPGFVVHDDGSSTSGFNFLGPEEWRKAGYVPVQDTTVEPDDPETEELVDQPVYTIKKNKVEMKRPVRKRKRELAEQSRAFRQELDQRHADIMLLRQELDALRESVNIAPDIDISSLDARGLLQVLRAQHQIVLNSITELRQRIDKLEGTPGG